MLTPHNTHVFWVFVEAGFHKLLESLGVVAGELGRVVLGDEEEHTHGVKIRVGWFTFGQLDRCDAQAPDVSLGKETALNKTVSFQAWRGWPAENHADSQAYCKPTP